MLPPDRLLVGVSSDGVLTSYSATRPAQWVSNGVEVEEAPLREALLAVVDQQEVLGHREFGDRTRVHPLFRHVGESVAPDLQRGGGR